MINLGEDCNLDIQKLISTRMLITANSGGGKSWAGRRMMEKCANQVQQIIIDWDGEFVTLREKYDFLLVSQDGDVPISIKSAELLATKLLELKVSAIIDLSELKRHERHLFVRRFLESLVNSPNRLWGPLLIYVDEAHQLAPEGKSGKAESKPAMSDLATLGRKRGFAGIFMTQRLSKLDKDLAAELNNQIIGRTTLDIDRKRAADNLGFRTKEEERALRELPNGVFHAFGPAFEHTGIMKMKVGDIETTHPDRARGVLIKPTATPDNIKKVLKDLIDLPKEAAEELKTKQDMKNKISELKREVRKLEHSKPKTLIKVDEKGLERSKQQGFKEAENHYLGILRQTENTNKSIKKVLDSRDKFLQQLIANGSKLLQIEAPKIVPISAPSSTHLRPSPAPIQHQPVTQSHQESPKETDNIVDGDEPKLGICAKKIYSVLYGNQEREFTKVQLGLLSGYSPKSSSFHNSLSQLNAMGLIKRNNGNLLFERIAEDYNIQPFEEISQELWSKNLGICARKIFYFLLENGDMEYSKEEISENVEYSVTSSSFHNSLSQLCSLGLAQRNNGLLKVNPEILEL